MTFLAKNNKFAFQYVCYWDKEAFSTDCSDLLFVDNFNDAIKNKLNSYWMHDLGTFYYDYGVLHITTDGVLSSIWVVKVNEGSVKDNIKDKLIKIWDKKVGYLIDLF